MVDKVIDLSLEGNDVKLKLNDNGDGTYSPVVEAGITGDVIIDDVEISSIAAGDNNIGNVDIVSLPAITGSVSASPILITASADLTQKITGGAPGSPVQGPNKTNPGGWILRPLPANTGAVYFMFHGQTTANKGFPMAAGESMYVPVENLDSLDFDVTTSGNVIMAAKC